MAVYSDKILGVPTNIITGFLGVGKTTAILHLLKNKPKKERWAILVNEFGEIGVDGSLMSGQYAQEDGVFIREVPGGCMCCAAGLPMQIALNQLLTRAKPDRLLIEPTGLGHPKEVIEVLSSEHYKKILDLHKCITLVDARKLKDVRYTEHETFNQQIDIADIVIGHKRDLYGEGDKERLAHFIESKGKQNTPILFTQNGEISISALEGKSLAVRHCCSHSHVHTPSSAPTATDQTLPESGVLQVSNSGEGYKSLGWRFAPSLLFNRKRVFDLLSGLNIERAKGVFITPEGIFGYNVTQDTVTEVELDDCLESRIEVIGGQGALISEPMLLECLERPES